MKRRAKRARNVADGICNFDRRSEPRSCARTSGNLFITQGALEIVKRTKPSRGGCRDWHRSRAKCGVAGSIAKSAFTAFEVARSDRRSNFFCAI